MSKIIIFVEDPGAANFVFEKNFRFLNQVRIYSVEPAFSYLKKRNIKTIYLDNKINLKNIFNNRCK